MNRVQHRKYTCQSPSTADSVQIVGQSNSVSASDLEDLVLAVAIEGRPADISVVNTVLSSSPLKRHLLLLVTNLELATFVLRRETDH